MEGIERSARTRRRRGYLQHAILSAVAITGVLAVALVAPNSVQLLSRFGYNKSRFGEKTRQSIGRLLNKQYIRFVTMGGKKHIVITEKGRNFLEKSERRAILCTEPIKPRRWDARWRIVMFDIPERHKALRQRIREMIRAFGFLCLQGSVWIYPYDCEDLIILLKADLKIGKELLYVVVEEMENDTWLRKHFSLNG